MSYARSARYFLIALPAMLAVNAIVVVALPRQWLSPALAAGGPVALVAALSSLYLSALTEELAKATGVGLQALRSNHFGWYWIVALTVGTFGLIERAMRLVYLLPDSRPVTTVAWIWEATAVIFHIALTMSAVVVARLMGGRHGWIVGVLIAGTIHFLYNLLHAERVMIALSATTLLLGFSYRKRLDWRAPSAL